MRILQTKPIDATNGPGVRYSIWIAGCHFHCDGCWNPESWSFNQGTPYGKMKKQLLKEIFNNPYINGVSILGGEPLSEYMRKGDTDILDLCLTLHKLGYNIWMWTGYKWDDIKDKAVIRYVDTIITGQFEKDKKDLTLPYMGSSNQEIHHISGSSLS